MTTKLRKELDMEEDPMCEPERTSPAAAPYPNALDYNNFNGTDNGIVLCVALIWGWGFA